MLIFLGFVAAFLPSIYCLEGPYIYDNYTRIITVKEGDSPKLECYANDYFSITWHKDITYSRHQNATLPNGQTSCECGNILELPSITKDQRGYYVCTAEGEYGSASKFITVFVVFAPIITETHRVDRIENKELELRCIAIAHPIPEVVWTKNNITLSTDNYRITDEPEYDDGFNTALVVSTESDYSGTYECRITNSAGYSIMTFEVTAPILRRHVESSHHNPDKKI